MSNDGVCIVVDSGFVRITAADVDCRCFPNGGKVCNLRIATSESWKDKDGNKQERTQWHQVAIFSEPLANIAEKYLRKGSKVYIEGQLETRKWQDQTGADRYSTEVVLRPYKGELTLLDSKGSDEGSSGKYDSGYGGAPSGDQSQGHSDMDDEIPF